MKISSVDHFVLTVASLDETVAFYTQVLGMELLEFGQGRLALSFGEQKINLHQHTKEFEPKALHPTPGSTDFCLITSSSIADVVEWLNSRNVDIELGPVPRTGAVGDIVSVYIRDPDRNLVEIAQYV